MKKVGDVIIVCLGYGVVMLIGVVVNVVLFQGSGVLIVFIVLMKLKLLRNEQFVLMWFDSILLKVELLVIVLVKVMLLLVSVFLGW